MEQYINKIICADCLDILKQLPDKCVDLVLTDPPYGMFFQSNYRQDKYARTQNELHPTQKPIELFSFLVAKSTNENDLVLDCFSGSGTTAIACHKLKRRFICIEKNPEYWKASCERLEQEQKQIIMEF